MVKTPIDTEKAIKQAPAPAADDVLRNELLSAIQRKVVELDTLDLKMVLATINSMPSAPAR